MASRSKHLWSHAYKSQQLPRMRNCHYYYRTTLKNFIHSNCSPEMTLNKISKSVACTFFLQTQPASFYNLGRQPYRTEQGQGVVFLTCRTWGFSMWLHQLPSISGPGRRDFLTDDKLAIPNSSSTTFKGSRRGIETAVSV